MPTFHFLYVREQRARTTIEAATRAEADNLAERWLNNLPVGWDESDDRGELSLEETDEKAAADPNEVLCEVEYVPGVNLGSGPHAARIVSCPDAPEQVGRLWGVDRQFRGTARARMPLADQFVYLIEDADA